jgi:hypothetical protein
VLVKKQRPKPKPKAKTNANTPVAENPVQRSLNLPSQEQIVVTQQKEAAIRAANFAVPKPHASNGNRISQELARLRNQILGVSSEQLPDMTGKPSMSDPKKRKEKAIRTNDLEKRLRRMKQFEKDNEDKYDRNDKLKADFAAGKAEEAELRKQLEELEEEERLSGGADGTIEGGLYDEEISNMMKNVKTFQGVIASDEIGTLRPKPAISFVMNKDPRGAPGSHWVAVYIDTLMGKEVCYYDPLGNPPSESTRSSLKTLINEIDSRNMCKLKINTMKNQNSDSDSCGFQCIRFLKDMIGGMSFKKATGYSPTIKDNSDKFEDKAERLANKFGYV